MLEAEFEYYLNNQEDLVSKYEGKFLVIKKSKILGIYDSHIEAYHKTLETEEIGTFLIQHCLPGTDSYTQVFHSQVMLDTFEAPFIHA